MLGQLRTWLSKPLVGQPAFLSQTSATFDGLEIFLAESEICDGKVVDYNVEMRSSF